MRRVVLFLAAIVLVLLGWHAPRFWAPFAGQLRFTGNWYSGNAVTGSPLAVEQVSQYQGLATDNVNCGPASIAALLRWIRPDLATSSEVDLVARVRQDTGKAAGGTTIFDLTRALDDFGVPSAPLYGTDARGDDTDPLAAIRLALEHGRPVLILVNDAAIGGGPASINHWVVLTGLNLQTNMVDVVDPGQVPGTTSVGGNTQWPTSVLRGGIRDVGGLDGLDALVIGAHRSGVAPSVVFLPAAGFLVLLGLVPRRRRTPLPEPSHTPLPVHVM